MAWLWLLGTLLGGVGAYLVGWPAWTAYRTRESRDLNAERYLAWRGRAQRGGSHAARAGITARERRRLWLAGALAAGAIACLVLFFATS